MSKVPGFGWLGVRTPSPSELVAGDDELRAIKRTLATLMDGLPWPFVSERDAESHSPDGQLHRACGRRAGTAWRLNFIWDPEWTRGLRFGWGDRANSGPRSRHRILLQMPTPVNCSLLGRAPQPRKHDTEHPPQSRPCPPRTTNRNFQFKRERMGLFTGTL
jgi:hypothetical protein